VPNAGHATVLLQKHIHASQWRHGAGMAANGVMVVAAWQRVSVGMLSGAILAASLPGEISQTWTAVSPPPNAA